MAVTNTAIELPTHGGLVGFETQDNELVLGGKRLSELVPEDQRAPKYIYDRDRMRRRVETLRSALPSRIKLHYAMKANPMPEVVALMATLVDGLDIASAGELEVATNSQLPREEISFAGPGKMDWELKAAIEAGVVLNAESEGEIARAGVIAASLGRQANVAVRVNPDFELKLSGMKMSGGPKPFGIDAERVPDVLESIDGDHVRLYGLHIFAGSQNLSVESIQEAHGKTFELATRLIQAAPRKLAFVNIGGGLGVPYFPGETPIDLGPVAENLQRLCQQFDLVAPDTDLVMELGRYLVAEAGVYVCRVIDIKESRGVKYLVTNGGLHHHLAASGNFGQVIRKNYPVVLGNRLHSANTEKVTVVGPLCTPLDILGSNVELPKAEVGDLVVVMQSGAYGYSASPHAFLSHPAPEQVLV